MNQVFRFSGGRYRHDTTTERQLLAARFQKSQLTPAQRRRLSKIEIILPDDVIFTEAKALCDFVYYGDRTGNGKAVDKLIATLQPSLRQRVKDFRKSLAEIGIDPQPRTTSQNDVSRTRGRSRFSDISQIVAPVPRTQRQHRISISKA